MGESKESTNCGMSLPKPQAGPQRRFLSCKADIAVYGGAAGGGKTFALLLEPLRHVENARFGGVIFRRTMEQVRNMGGLWEESQGVYPILGGKPVSGQMKWVFPSGASIRFEHLRTETDKLQYQGAQYAFLGFDELTHFSESQFFYMLSRARSTSGVKPYVRATTNPDAQSWVKRFLAPWVDGTFATPAKSGETRYFIRDGGQIRWVAKGTKHARSVCFVRANVWDNKALLDKDPGYLDYLRALPLVDRRRLLDGDWEIVEGGNLFRREWFALADVLPALSELRSCRYWDLAGSAEAPGRDPDWTVGVLMGASREGLYYVIDVTRVRATPAGVEALVRQTAELDRERFGAVTIRMEQEPGSAGVMVIDRFLRLILPGFDFRPVSPSGEKAVRARPLSAQAEAGNVRLLKGSWNLEFLNEMVAFPMAGVHDDQVDAACGAMEELATGVAFNAVYGGATRNWDGLLR